MPTVPALPRQDSLGYITRLHLLGNVQDEERDECGTHLLFQLLERLRQEDCKFKDFLSYRASPDPTEQPSESMSQNKQ